MIKVLIVDDYEDWRRTVRELLQECPELQVIWEASDGLEAIRMAEELKPDLILLDIGLPKLNGIEAALRIRLLFPSSKIIFLSQDNSFDPEELALSTDAQGYVYKTDETFCPTPLARLTNTSASLCRAGWHVRATFAARYQAK
jgi:DNA-binding NarL/FixJ family response regulator